MYSVVKRNLDLLLLTIFHLGSSLPQSRQLGKDQNICMWVINIISLKKGYVCGSLLAHRYATFLCSWDVEI